MALDSTSSSLSPIPSSQCQMRPTASQEVQQFRSAQDLPFELAQHVQIYFEESLFTQGIGMLMSLVSASASNTSQQPIIVPPPHYLSLISTLTVHPSITTRTKSQEKWEQANSALRLLRLLNKIVGPVNCRLSDAYVFRHYHIRSGQFSNDDLNPTPSINRLTTPYADSENVFFLAEDFWAVVGWIFNCSCLPSMYHARWIRWMLWLEYMLTVLETDWNVHLSTDTCEESLMWQYIELAMGGHARARRMLRAIFANGSTNALNEFREVFRKELREPKTDKDKLTTTSKTEQTKMVDVDIDKDEYADYMTKNDSDVSIDDDDDFDDEQVEVGSDKYSRPSKRLRTRTRTPSARRMTPRTSNNSLRSETDNNNADHDPLGASRTLGPPSSISLRLRLLHLLLQISTHPTLAASSPTTFPDQHELLTLLVEFIKPLPIPVYASFLLPSIHPSEFDTHHLLLCVAVAERTIESSAPRGSDEWTQQRLETEFLPYTAGRATVDAQCRMAIVLESLVRRMAVTGGLKRRKRLNKAVRVGVETREAKASEARKAASSKRGRADEEEEAWNWLVESGQRMESVVDGLA